MLNLEEHKVSDIRAYYGDLKSKLLLEISKSKLRTNAKLYLTESRIQEILEAKPSRLFEIHEEFLHKLNKNYSTSEYEDFLILRRKKKPNASEKKIIRKYKTTQIQLSKIFDYEKIISSNKKRSYELSKIISRNTCTYCNRLYTFTIIRKDENTGHVNDTTRITRPQFDHWLAKKKYPLFGLSFYNLIPSCSVCNSSVKGEDTYNLKSHMHPYVNEPKESFKFSYVKSSYGKNEVLLKFNGAKVERTMNDLKIKEIYDEHSDFELQDLLDLRYKYSDNYLDILFNSTFDLGEVKKKDAYRMVFGIEIDPEDFHKRPFSKFKYDILKELKLIR